MVVQLMEPAEPKSPGHAAFLATRAQRIRKIRGELARLYPDPAGLVLELGCGHGHYLTAYAEAHPDARCLGIDLVTKRILKASAKRDKRELGNLHFLKAEVGEFLAAWPDWLHLDRVFILFPDPWPKKRHAKNRIIQPALLEQLADLGRPGTRLHFRTDDAGNFDWCREVIGGHHRWRILAEAPWPFENSSFFQDLFNDYASLTAERVDS